MATPLHIFCDIETDSLKADRLLQIGAITEEGDCFNITINPKQTLPSYCTKLTGLFYYKGDLYKNGKVVESVTIRDALQQFTHWLGNFEQKIVLVFHNGFGFDCCTLIKFCLRFNITVPTNIESVSDSLPLFRRHLRQGTIQNHQLITLAKHYNVPIVCIHDAFADCCLLKAVCEQLAIEKSIPLDKLLLEYQKPFEFFVEKVQHRLKLL